MPHRQTYWGPVLYKFAQQLMRIRLIWSLTIFFWFRKSVQQTDLHWDLTLSYCKREFILAMICISMSFSCSAFGMTSNLFFHVNSYRLPVEFIIVFLPFDGISINWFLNYMLQVVAAISLAIFLYTYFPTTLTIMNHTCLKIDSSILAVEKLNQILENSSKDESSKLKIRDQMRSIVEMTTSVQAWHKDAQGLIKYNFLVEFGILSVLLSMCIYKISSNLFGSILMLMTVLVVLSQHFIYCWMGSRVTSKFHKLTSALYDTSWYLMESREQKSLQIIMNMTQNMKGFNGIFKAVSLETFQKVSNIENLKWNI